MIALLRRLLPARLQRILASSEPRKRLAKGSFWALCGAVGSRIMLVLFSMVSARLLGATTVVGEWGIINSTIILFQVFTGYSMGVTVTRYVATNFTVSPKRVVPLIFMALVVTTVLSAVVAGIMCAVAPWMAETLLQNSGLTVLLRIASIAVLAGSIAGVLKGALSGLAAFRSLAIIDVFSSFIRVTCILTGIYVAGLPGGVVGFAVALTAGLAVALVYLIRELKSRDLPFVLKGWTGEWRMFTAFGLPSVFSHLAVTPALWFRNVLVIDGCGYEAMGVMTVFLKWMFAFLYVPTVVNQVALSIMSRARSETKDDNMPLLSELIALNMLMGIPAFLLLALLSRLILSGYGPEYVPYWPAFIVLQSSVLLQILQAPIVKALEASGRMWTSFCVALLWSLCLLGFTGLFAVHGIMGVCFAQLCAFVIVGVYYIRIGLQFRGPQVSEPKEPAEPTL